MNHIISGIISGTIFGLISVAIMIPLSFSDKRAAMLGAFFNRFATGFLISVSLLPMYGWFKGLLIGFLISLPDAIITKAYAPIIGFGIIGGAIIGAIVG